MGGVKVWMFKGQKVVVPQDVLDLYDAAPKRRDGHPDGRTLLGKDYYAAAWNACVFATSWRQRWAVERWELRQRAANRDEFVRRQADIVRGALARGVSFHDIEALWQQSAPKKYGVGFWEIVRAVSQTAVDAWAGICRASRYEEMGRRIYQVLPASGV